jgi:hypothetical protein
MHDANHRVVVIHDEYGLGQIDGHRACARNGLSPEGGDR